MGEQFSIHVPQAIREAARGGITENGQAYQLLSEHFKHIECHTMASSLLRAAEGDTQEQRDFQKLLNSEFFATARANSARFAGSSTIHNKSQDETADLIELSNIIIDTPVAEAVGEMLVRRVDMTQATRKIRIRHPAEAEDTDRGAADMGRGTKSTFINLQPEDELESHSSWDQKYLEDVEWSVATDETKEIAEALRRKTSLRIINAIDAIPAADTSIGALHQCAAGGTFSFNDMVDMRQLMISKYVSPDRLIANPIQMGDLIKQDVFQDALKYGDYVDKGRGYIGYVLGMDVYESAQQPLGHVSLLASMNCMIWAVRRYMMAESYEEVRDANRKYGVKVSTRHQLVTGSPLYALRTENA